VFQEFIGNIPALPDIPALADDPERFRDADTVPHTGCRLPGIGPQTCAFLLLIGALSVFSIATLENVKSPFYTTMQP